MWLIAGLGNPGQKYSKHRHNIGFMVVDVLSEQGRIQMSERESYIIGKGVWEGENVALLKPLTYMNRSGLAIERAMKKLNVGVENLIVVHDDLDMNAGSVKIRKTGSSGGHRGIESAIIELGSMNFIRVKIGIGRDTVMPVENYVLSGFRPDEKEQVKDAIIKAADAVKLIISSGPEKAMNKFNRAARPSATQL
ncbi:MAG: aminoacyl-tRNA hydrolase [Nitrospirae bacterium]|nr:MAG: aminoacyl-tRNA hydrolase [Nitrospirota bacterium]